MQAFQHVFHMLNDLGARVAGISADTFASLGAFAEQQSLEFPLLSDWPERATIAAFGVAREGAPTAARATFVFDADGVLRGVIDEPRDMTAHPAGALRILREITGAS